MFLLLLGIVFLFDVGPNLPRQIHKHNSKVVAKMYSILLYMFGSIVDLF